MIKKLRTKVSLIILLAISGPLLLIVIFYNFSYYNNVIKANISFVERFPGEQKVIPDSKRDNNFDISQMEGIYSVFLNNGDIVNNSENVTDEIKQYALKIANDNKDNGIIGNYIYKKRVRNDEINIILIESTNEINKIKTVILTSILISGISIALIYILSKKIARIIVKPVEDTFAKQIEFISDASHELKTPLAVIQANTDVLEGELGQNKWLSYIQNETENMGKLINELLLLTKIENVDYLRKPEKFNMSNHIEIVISTFESMAFEKKVQIETKIQKDVITEQFNKDDIEHILSTLIDNAIKHTEEQKKLIVEFKQNKDKLIINVKNKGEEIPESERSRIFDRFYRIDKARNRNEKRYGLGLAIALSTVKKNNGTINVDYRNGYTIFSVELPL